MIKQFIVLTFLLITATSYGEDLNKGILKYSLDIDGQQYGEPGQIINFSKGAKRHYVQIEVDGKKHDVDESFIIPYDPDFTPYKLYLMLSSGYPFEEVNSGASIKNRYLLAKGAVAAFPSNELSDKLILIKCEATERYEGFSKDGKDWSESITCFSNYLKQYPKGLDNDQINWKLFELRNAVYEFEGDIESILTQAKKYEKYLSEHAISSVADEIRFKLAKYYQMAYESFYFRSGDERLPGYSGKDAKGFLAKAQNIYQILLQSKEIKSRAKARIALYNMKHNRRIYVNSNAW